MLRHPAAVDPLGGLAAKRLLATGDSQSAFRLVTYVNAIEPRDRVYDGFLVHSRSGSGAPLSQPPQPAVDPPNPTRIRDDVGVPVLTFETETDLEVLHYLGARQPDSKDFRLWEVAGTAHADSYTVGGASDTGNGTPRSRSSTNRRRVVRSTARRPSTVVDSTRCSAPPSCSSTGG